jgi:hypothetical protein
MKHLRHVSEILATCVYKTDKTVGIDAYNKCNILIYFCNICMKQLKHTSETTETYLATCLKNIQKHLKHIIAVRA